MDLHCEFLRIPFGMMNTGATLTHAVKMLVRGMDYVMDYKDVLLVYRPTMEDHVWTLREHFKRLQWANFTVRPTKCALWARMIDFLGHRLGEGTIGLQAESVEKVWAKQRSKTKKEVRAFLGLADYHKEFIPDNAAISAPLSALVRERQSNPITWDDAQERANHSLKMAMTFRPVLHLADIDSKFVLRTDASFDGLGAALIHRSQAKIFPKAYASKKL
ncbi:Pol polyprotein [Plakobranchus ocellatus]|uniref:Pol polyprotein n=1 Tax=Plakobranchus ocellatus TaxID=259542 RepID=A0AAV4AIH4_9GAST|nr:Pol polyprotein [Plakobranchus ocellatus]